MKLRVFVSSILLLTFVIVGGASAIQEVQIAQAAEFDCAAVNELPQEECASLVALYVSMNGDNWLNRTNWLATTTPCADWYGVICEEGHIEEIYLPENNLQGSIPEQLGELPYLAFLDFSFNKIVGEISPRLSNLIILEELYLSANSNLTGEVPPEFVNLQNLNLLWLDGTGVCGVVSTVETASVEPQLEPNPEDPTFDVWLANIDDVRGSNLSCAALSQQIYLPLINK